MPLTTATIQRASTFRALPPAARRRELSASQAAVERVLAAPATQQHSRPCDGRGGDLQGAIALA